MSFSPRPRHQRLDQRHLLPACFPARILAAWRDHRFEIVVTPDTLAELETH